MIPRPRGTETGQRPATGRTVPSPREFIAFWMEGDRVVAGMNVNVWDVTDGIKALISSRASISDSQLANPDIPLSELVTAEKVRTVS